MTAAPVREGVRDQADRGIGDLATPGEPSLLSKARVYFMLTKPRIILLLLVTTVPAMVLAAGGMPSGWLVVNTLLGGSLAAGGANAVNCYVDRDIDLKMERTAGRPIPSGSVSPLGALIFGLALGAVAFVYLMLTVNLLTASLATGALGFYVLIYTLLLKRHTSLNIVIGGAAGAVPVLCGWTAVRDGLALAPVVLFAVVFMWTPPHFWALAIKYKDEYEAAGIPMLPVTRGIPGATRAILFYTWQMVAVTLLLVPIAKLGPAYLLAALVLGGIFVVRAVRLRRQQTVEAAMKLFKFSITYLFLLFVAIAADVLIRNPGP